MTAVQGVHTGVVEETDLLARLCEASTASYWSWLICMLDEIVIPAADYTSRRAGKEEEEEEEADMSCDSAFASARFEAGAVHELAFATELCRESKLSHQYSHQYTLWQIEDWESLQERFASFDVEGAAARARRASKGGVPTQVAIPTARHKAL